MALKSLKICAASQNNSDRIQITQKFGRIWLNFYRKEVYSQSIIVVNDFSMKTTTKDIGRKVKHKDWSNLLQNMEGNEKKSDSFWEGRLIM